MSLPREMQEDERTIFGLHSLGGYIVSVSGLLVILAVLTYYAITVQSREATNYYDIDRDLNSLKFNDAANHKYRIQK